jgi:glycosyltransferase involved in cell wall biosynthesis
MINHVALLTHALDGGVWTVARFLLDALASDSRYAPDLLVMATSARDAASKRLTSPRTWLTEPQIIEGRIADKKYRHVGAVFTELEFQRYRPRRVLTGLLTQYDLVQVVAGTPAWAAVAREVERPVCLFTATTIAQDRLARLRQTIGWRKAWLSWMTRLNARVERQTLPWLNCVFAESDYTRRQLAPYVSPDRLRLGPPGVDTGFFKPAAAYCTDGYIIAVGRLNDPRKNARLLLTAYWQMRQQLGDGPKLMLVGHNGLSPEDQAYAAALGLTEHIETHVAVSMEQLRALYQQAALFVLSSDEEGLGIVILEAMACGLPIVSTDCGGPATAIQSGVTGLLTPVGNSTALAQAMLELWREPERRRRLGQAGRRVVEQRFSLAAAGKVYLDVYDELLRRDSSSRAE